MEGDENAGWKVTYQELEDYQLERASREAISQKIKSNSENVLRVTLMGRSESREGWGEVPESYGTHT